MKLPNSVRTAGLTVALIAALLAPAGSTLASGLVPIAVVDFTASGRTPYQESVPEFVVDELVNSGKFDILEREKLSSIVGEIGFQATSGFVNPESAVQVGSMLGARLLVTGHILDQGREQKRFSGYGITTTKTIYRLKARLEVIDVTSGSKIFSHIADASQEVQAVQGQNYDNTQKDLGARVARKLVAAMLGSPRVKRLVDGPEAVTLVINSDPAEADLEIDGTFYGSAGQEIKVNPGIHTVKVSLPGYLDWEKRVMVQDGTSITARLKQDNTTRTETKLKVEVN